jgi:hypothetical protein
MNLRATRSYFDGPLVPFDSGRDDDFEPPPTQIKSAGFDADRADGLVLRKSLSSATVAFSFAGVAKAVANPFAPIPGSELYVGGGGDTGKVAANDVNQADLGDCYFMASVAALARANPKAIEDMVRVNRDAAGNVTSYTVRLWDKESTWFGLSSKNVRREITVDAKFPATGRGNPGDVDPVTGQVEIWPLVLEKAYAQMRGGYGEIGKGGQPLNAMFALTGRDGVGYASANFAGRYAPPARGWPGGNIAPTVTWDTLKRDFDAGKIITMSSVHVDGDKKGTRLPYNVVANHAYAVAGFREVGGVKMVDLQNPWGFDHVSIPYSALAGSFRQINVL